MAELLTTENLRQFAHGFDLLLPFEIKRSNDLTPINVDGDTWEVRLVKPRGGGMLVKTTGLAFPDDTIQKISVPVEPLDLDRNGVYYYQVVKTTGGAEVRANVAEFTVLPSLPVGLPIAPSVSPQAGSFPVYQADGSTAASLLETDGVDLFWDGNPIGGGSIAGTPKYFPKINDDGDGLEDSQMFDFGSYLKYQTLSEDPSEPAFQFLFRGWNGAAYTKGLLIHATSGSAYGAEHLIMKCTAYNTYSTIGVGAGTGWRLGGSNLVLQTENGGLAPIWFRTNYSGAGYSTPRFQVISQGAVDVAINLKMASGQTANAFEIDSYSGSNGDLAHFKGNGELFVLGTNFKGYAETNKPPDSQTFPNSNDWGFHRDTSSGNFYLVYNYDGIINFWPGSN